MARESESTCTVSKFETVALFRLFSNFESMDLIGALPPWMKAVERLVQSAIPQVLESVSTSAAALDTANTDQEAEGSEAQSDSGDDRSVIIAGPLDGDDGDNNLEPVESETQIPAAWHFYTASQDDAGKLR